MYRKQKRRGRGAGWGSALLAGAGSVLLSAALCAITAILVSHGSLPIRAALYAVQVIPGLCTFAFCLITAMRAVRQKLIKALLCCGAAVLLLFVLGLLLPGRGQGSAVWMLILTLLPGLCAGILGAARRHRALR